MKREMLTVVMWVLGVLAVMPVVPMVEAGNSCGLLKSGATWQIALQQDQSIGNKAGERVINQETSGKEGAERRIDVAVGQEFTVTLASNATTGYHWELAAPLDGDVVRLVGSEYRVFNTGLLGAPGEEIWTFQAIGPGQTVISLKYVRPWEKDVAPVETASYGITVHY